MLLLLVGHGIRDQEPLQGLTPKGYLELYVLVFRGHEEADRYLKGIGQFSERANLGIPGFALKQRNSGYVQSGLVSQLLER